MRFLTAAIAVAPLLLTACTAFHHSPHSSLQAGVTQPGITAEDLEKRVNIFASDSMLGRRTGTEGEAKAIAYLVSELQRLGLHPAGDNGTYLQSVPIALRTADQRSTLAVNDRALRWGADFVILSPLFVPVGIENARAIYGGVSTPDTLTYIPREQAKGKVVILTIPPGGQIPRPHAYPGSYFSQAAALVYVALDTMPEDVRRATEAPVTVLRSDAVPRPTTAPATIYVTERVASQMLGAELSEVELGHLGQPVTGAVVLSEPVIPAYNVVAIIPGSPSALPGEYVGISAHLDAQGVRRPAVDHDSLRAFNSALRRLRISQPEAKPSQRDLEALRAAAASERGRKASVRRDSIRNGADDNASGSMALLEVAEVLSSARRDSERSVLFIWHTSEERGLYGSRYFSDHPTVVRDSIIAMLNLDMIGRGGANDIMGGGPAYLQLIGSRRLSTGLGEVIESVNRAQPQPFDFDYSYDAEGHPEQFYCRSDHAMYARYGIPVAFFTTGSHADYHEVTDESEYMDFPKLARVTELAHGIVTRLARIDRLPLDEPKQRDPNAPCRQ